jgi:uncharacterized protein
VARHPFTVHVGEALRHPGSRAPLALAGPIPGIALTTVQVPEDAEVRFDGVVEAQGAQVLVQGSVRAPWTGECRRCLRTTSGVVTVELREVFEDQPIEGETFPLLDEQIDLEPVLREAVALGLPLAPLCEEGCAGPDPEGHPVGVADEAGAGIDGEGDDEQPRDPRWDALDQLQFESDVQDSTLRPDGR